MTEAVLPRHIAAATFFSSVWKYQALKYTCISFWDVCDYSLRVEKQTTLLPCAHAGVGVNCFASLCIMFLIRTITEDELCVLLNWLFVLIAEGSVPACAQLTCFSEASLDGEGDLPSHSLTSHIEKHPRGCCLIPSPHLSLKQDIFPRFMNRQWLVSSLPFYSYKTFMLWCDFFCIVIPAHLVQNIGFKLH